jgi:uncharacterized membrane protein YhhN
LLVVLALSSRAQCLFGLDSASAMTRHRLLPFPGWMAILAKDLGFLLIAVTLTLALAPGTGAAAALAALAFGHRASVLERRPQTRWRFSGGAGLGDCAVQVFLLSGTGAAAFREGPWVLIPAALICAGSAWCFGRSLDRV